MYGTGPYGSAYLRGVEYLKCNEKTALIGSQQVLIIR